MSTWEARKRARENGQPASASAGSPPKPLPVFVHPSKPASSSGTLQLDRSYFPTSSQPASSSKYPAQPIASSSKLPARSATNGSGLGTSAAYVPSKGSGFIPIPLKLSGKKEANGSLAFEKTPSPSPIAGSFGHRRLATKRSVESGELVDDGQEEEDVISPGFRLSSRASATGSSSSAAKGKDRDLHYDTAGAEAEQHPGVGVVPDTELARVKTPESARSRRRSSAGASHREEELSEQRDYRDRSPVDMYHGMEIGPGIFGGRGPDGGRSRREEDIPDRGMIRDRSPSQLDQNVKESSPRGNRRRVSDVGRRGSPDGLDSISRRSSRRSLKDDHHGDSGESRTITREPGPKVREEPAYRRRSRDRRESVSDSRRADSKDRYPRDQEDRERKTRVRHRSRSYSRDRERSRDRGTRGKYTSDSESDRRDRDRDRDRHWDRNHDRDRERDRHRRRADRTYEDDRREHRSVGLTGDNWHRDRDQPLSRRDSHRRRDHSPSDSIDSQRREPSLRASYRSTREDRSRSRIRDVSHPRDSLKSPPKGRGSSDVGRHGHADHGRRNPSPSPSSGSDEQSNLPPPRQFPRALPPHLAVKASVPPVAMEGSQEAAGKTAADSSAAPAATLVDPNSIGEARERPIQPYRSGILASGPDAEWQVQEETTASTSEAISLNRKHGAIAAMLTTPFTVERVERTREQVNNEIRTAAEISLGLDRVDPENGDRGFPGRFKATPQMSVPSPPEEPAPEPPTESPPRTPPPEFVDDPASHPVWTVPVMPAAAYVIPDRGNFLVTFDPATDGKDPLVIAKAKRKNRTLPKKKEVRFDGMSKGNAIEVSDPRLDKNPADLAKLRAMTSLVPVRAFKQVARYPWTLASTGHAPPSALCITGLHALTTRDAIARAVSNFAAIVDVQAKLDRKGEQMGICWLKLKSLTRAANEESQILADHAAAEAVKTRYNGQRMGTSQVEVVSIVMDGDGSKTEAAVQTELQQRQAIITAAEAENSARQRATSAHSAGAAFTTPAAWDPERGSLVSTQIDTLGPRSTYPLHSKSVSQGSQPMLPADYQQSHNTNPPRSVASGPPTSRALPINARFPFHPLHNEWLAQQAAFGGTYQAFHRPGASQPLQRNSMPTHSAALANQHVPPIHQDGRQRLQPQHPQNAFAGGMASFAENPFPTFNGNAGAGGTLDHRSPFATAPSFTGNMANFAENPFGTDVRLNLVTSGPPHKRRAAMLGKDNVAKREDEGDGSAASHTDLLAPNHVSPLRFRAAGRNGDISDASDSDRETPLLISPGRRRARRHGDLGIRLRSPPSEDASRDNLVATALRSNSHDYIFISAKELSPRKEFVAELIATFDVPRPSEILHNLHGWYVFFADAAGARRTTTLKKQSSTINGRYVVLQLRKGSAQHSPQAPPAQLISEERSVPAHIKHKTLSGPTRLDAPAPIEQAAPTSVRHKRARAIIQSDSEEEEFQENPDLGMSPINSGIKLADDKNSELSGLPHATTATQGPSPGLNKPRESSADTSVGRDRRDLETITEVASQVPAPLKVARSMGKAGVKAKAERKKAGKQALLQPPVARKITPPEALLVARPDALQDKVKKDKPQPRKKAKTSKGVAKQSEAVLDAGSRESSSLPSPAIITHVVDNGLSVSADHVVRQKRLVLPDLLDSGVVEDDEDLYLLRLAAEAAATGTIPEVPDAALNDQDDASSLGPHPSGSARTHGYYKTSEAAKSAYLPQRNKAAVDEEAIPVVAGGNSRSTRVATRRLVLGMEQHKKAATDSDVFQFNQLRTRKKQLKFSKSPIHDWGLYAVEAIPLGEMVIEYVGEVIRAQVADIREKWYEKIGIGSSYLFRVDDDAVVDATKKGNLGRLINHCCTPNCTAKIITINGDKKIVIYARDNIEPGHEITYDYHFPIEQEKIVCLCGSAKCRGFLN